MVVEGNRWLIAGYSDAHIRFFDRNTQSLVDPDTELKVGPQGFSISAMDVARSNGRRIVAAASGLHEIEIFDASDASDASDVRRNSPKLLKRHVANAAVGAIALGPEGEMLVFGDEDGGVRKWHWETEDHPTALKCPDRLRAVASIACSSDGTRVAAVCGDQVAIWNPRTGVHWGTVDHSGAMRATFSPDGRILAIAGSNLVAFWDVENTESLQVVDHVGVTSVAFSEDGQLIASAGSYGASIWDVKTGKLFCPALSHGAIEVARFLDRKTLLTVDDLGTVREDTIPAVMAASTDPVMAPAGASRGFLLDDLGLLGAEDLPPKVAVVRVRRPRKQLFRKATRIQIARALASIAASLIIAALFTLRPSPGAESTAIAAERRPHPPRKVPDTRPDARAATRTDTRTVYIFTAAAPAAPPSKPSTVNPIEVAEKHKQFAEQKDKLDEKVEANKEYTRAGYLVENYEKAVRGYANYANQVANGDERHDPATPPGLAQALFGTDKRGGLTLRLPEHTDAKDYPRAELLYAEVLKEMELRLKSEIAEMEKKLNSEIAEARRNQVPVTAADPYLDLKQSGLEGIRPPKTDPGHVPLKDMAQREAEMHQRMASAVETILKDYPDLKVKSSTGKPQPMRSIVRQEFPDQYSAAVKKKTRLAAPASAKPGKAGAAQNKSNG